MTRKEIKDIIYNNCFDIVGEYLRPKLYNTSNDGENLLIYKELGFDSLDTINLVMQIENEFKIDLPDNLLDHNITLGILIDYIYEQQ